MAVAATTNEETHPQAAQHYCLFDSALGPCGLAWSERGLTRLQLPHSDAAATEAKMRANGRVRAEPPPPVQDAIRALQRYLAGEATDFGAISVDIRNVGQFRQAIYNVLRTVAWGRTVSYGELARLIGSPGEARAVGQAMGQNPVPVIIPCHRVVTSDGKLGGFSAYGGALTKEKLLDLEGVYVGSQTPRLPGL